MDAPHNPTRTCPPRKWLFVFVGSEQKAKLAGANRHDRGHLFSLTAHHGDHRQSARFPQAHDAFPCAGQVQTRAPGEFVAHCPMVGRFFLQQATDLHLQSIELDHQHPRVAVPVAAGPIPQSMEALSRVSSDVRVSLLYTFSQRVHISIRLQPLHSHVGDLQRQAASLAGRVDARLALDTNILAREIAGRPGDCVCRIGVLLERARRVRAMLDTGGAQVGEALPHPQPIAPLIERTQAVLRRVEYMREHATAGIGGLAE